MDKNSYTFIVSGYGTPNEKNLKIYEWDIASQHVAEKSSVLLENPTYAAYSSGNLYTLSEIIKDSTEKSSLYLLNTTTENSTICCIQDLKVKGIVHLDYSTKHNTLFGSCYGSGDVFSVGVDNQNFTTIKSLHQLPVADNGVSRAHCSKLDVSETFLFATHFNTDKICCFHVTDGFLTLNKEYPSLSLDAHTGPRHILFHKKMPIAYITCEKSNEVIVVKENTQTGELTVIQKISTLPENYTEISYVSNGCITPNHQHFLVANRGANTIVTFNIKADGTLSYASTSPSYGNWPRHIDCTTDGKYIFICNQKSSEFVIAPITPDGKLLNPCHIIPFNGCAFALDI